MPTRLQVLFFGTRLHRTDCTICANNKAASSGSSSFFSYFQEWIPSCLHHWSKSCKKDTICWTHVNMWTQETLSTICCQHQITANVMAFCTLEFHEEDAYFQVLRCSYGTDHGWETNPEPSWWLNHEVVCCLHGLQLMGRSKNLLTSI